jgi:hypothetical protein
VGVAINGQYASIVWTSKSGAQWSQSNLKLLSSETEGRLAFTTRGLASSSASPNSSGSRSRRMLARRSMASSARGEHAHSRQEGHRASVRRSQSIDTIHSR